MRNNSGGGGSGSITRGLVVCILGTALPVRNGRQVPLNMKITFY